MVWLCGVIFVLAVILLLRADGCLNFGYVLTSCCGECIC